MFQLEKSLEDWRGKLSNTNSFTKSDIEELESHLLDEIEFLKKKTLTDEEAFYVACDRIGSVDLISNEFRKINYNIIWFKRFLWLLSGYFLINFFQQFTNSLSIFTTNVFAEIIGLSSNGIKSLSLTTNIVLSILILSLLFLPKYKFISHLQKYFNLLFTYKRWMFVIVFFIFAIINEVGFKVFNALLVGQIGIEKYGNIMLGQGISPLVWFVSLCLIFIFISFKVFKGEE